VVRRKELADLAHALSGIVINRNFDIAGAWGVGVLCDRMTSTGTPAVVVDAVSGLMSPHSWDIAALAVESRRELQRQLRKRGMPTDWVVEASIEITYEPRESPIAEPAPPTRRWWKWGQFGGEFVGLEQSSGPTWFCDVTTRITNDHGRTYSATHREWCWSVQRSAYSPAQLPVRFRSSGGDDEPTG